MSAATEPKTEVKVIGKIASTFLGANEDSHGILTATLVVEHGGSIGTSHIGGYNLGSRNTAFGMQFVRHLLRAAGAESWEQLVGKTVFVIRQRDEWGRAIGIENLPTERGGRFIFDELADQYADRD